MDELKELLENVSDSYDDFVKCVYWAAQDREDGIELMVNYIRANPDAMSDDIMDWLEKMVCNLFPVEYREGVCSSYIPGLFDRSCSENFIIHRDVHLFSVSEVHYGCFLSCDM